MTADELRLHLLALIRSVVGLDAELQGKRIVVKGDGETFIVLVTPAKVVEPDR